MTKLLITTHMHVLLLIVGVVFTPMIANPYRKLRSRNYLDAEQSNKLRLDVATLVPVGVLLWNLLVYYAASVMGATPAAAASGRMEDVAQLAATASLTFEKAIAAAGESTVALATAIIFCRLCGGIWSDLHK